MTITNHLARLVVWATLLGVASAPAAAEIELLLEEGQVTVQIDGQLFTRYHGLGTKKPFLWPVIGPTGGEMTRAFPMRSSGDDETMDHPHHRSIWFAHGNVNGNDFWFEEKNSSSIEHREFMLVEQSPESIIATRNDWMDEEGVKVCSDLRAIRFAEHEDQRFIDFDITITNDTETPVVFGDTKEGSFAVRVADSMRAEKGVGGRIVNAGELTNEDAWGTAAAWIDYHGPVGANQELAGIAVLNHPNSFRFPTYWHARTYGLLAANCFGLRNFKNSRDEDGSHTLLPGESMSFFYRVVLHQGDERQARILDAFVEYAKVNKTPVDAQLTVNSALDPPVAERVPVVMEVQAEEATTEQSAE